MFYLICYKCIHLPCFPHRCTCSLHGTVTCLMLWSPVMAVRGWHPGTATDVCSVWTWTSARLASSVSSHPLLFEHWHDSRSWFRLNPTNHQFILIPTFSLTLGDKGPPSLHIIFAWPAVTEKICLKWPLHFVQLQHHITWDQARGTFWLVGQIRF